MKRLLAIAALAVLLGGCAATTPQPLKGDFLDVTPREAGQALKKPGKVRWGGEIVAVKTREGATCITIHSQPLDEIARPDAEDTPRSRFIACVPRRLDPRYYEIGRDVTVVGRVADIASGARFSEYQDNFAILATSVVYLWPDNRDYEPYPGMTVQR